MESSSQQRLEWRPVPNTAHWTLTDLQDGVIVRHIAVRDPYFNEPAGTKYLATGNGHKPSTHDSLKEAMIAAEASLG
ncbi:MAG: hypothetical protein WB698_05620 [Solirubrobacteraceae bacterium]|jgi:hypothetical protein